MQIAHLCNSYGRYDKSTKQKNDILESNSMLALFTLLASELDCPLAREFILLYKQ